jgi:hypothetical protein
MRYNLKIGKSRYSGKTIADCIDILAIRYTEISAACITPAAWILAEIASMHDDVRRLAYYDNTGKVFISINKGGK